MPTLQGLLAHRDPWIRINAAFALGELGPAAEECVPQLAALLRDPHSQVVRQTLDALGAIWRGLGAGAARGGRTGCSLSPRRSGRRRRVTRGWGGRRSSSDERRFGAVECRWRRRTSGRHRTHRKPRRLAIGNGYVSAIATEVLTRIGTPTAHRRGNPLPRRTPLGRHIAGSRQAVLERRTRRRKRALGCPTRRFDRAARIAGHSPPVTPDLPLGGPSRRCSVLSRVSGQPEATAPNLARRGTGTEPHRLTPRDRRSPCRITTGSPPETANPPGKAARPGPFRAPDGPAGLHSAPKFF